MEKVLFIGKFIESTKALHQHLKKVMAIQLCSDNVDVAKSMIQMYAPSLVLLNLEGLTENHEAIFQELEQKYSKMAVVTLGTEEDKAAFASYYGGTQFTHLTMPMDYEAITETIVSRAGIKVEDEKQAALNGSKLILLVDDSPVLLRSMKHMLEDKYRIAMATSGNQALQMIGKETPDLIILDYEMPVCDGKQTLEMIRAEEETKETPVVFLTGHGDADHIRSVLDLNPSAYFLKPPKAEKILEILDQLL